MQLLLLAGITFINGVLCSPTIEWKDNTNMISCKGRPDGYYADTTDAQDSFFRCKDNEVIEQTTCDRGSRYDPHSQQCSLTTALDTDCDQSDDSFYTTPGTLCRGYYRCVNGAREDYTCPKDSYFDMNSQFCVRTGGLCYELVCSGRVNGRYADTTHACRRSYVCEGGMLRSLGSCPPGSLYNGSSCQPREQVQCLTSEKSAVAVKILSTDPCAELPNGFQTLPDETCRNYLLCHSGQTIAKLHCATSEHFNGDKCVPATNTSCASYCADKPDGFTTDLRRQCRGYVSCVKGRVVEELACKDGSLFNGKTCVPALLYQCPVPVKKNVCSKLKDGYHQDYMTGCKEYFYCHQGQMLLRSTCRDGKVWNGSDCVSRDEFLCEGPEIWPGCSALDDGLYTDLSKGSKCRFYHYCSNGKKVRLSCPMGYVFNGKTCVEQDSYHCPLLDTDCHNKVDGYYSDPKSGCRSYYYCSNGQKLTYICPEGLLFNGTDCVNKRIHSCTAKISICSNKTNGYHADAATGCHKYVYCLQKVKITSFECSENSVFDGKKCVPVKTDSCTNAKESCDTLEDGLYGEPNSQCTRYFKCVGKKKTTTFTCRGG
ncbi:uncharacterized protein LOC129000940 [Macrosteles quadrilineatus]|uniref:uncharacterized protein LOC129000940 n=1 Tax=Macrosteles quadrilineatus TaxID=74068 RepID=UPI0023E0E592|nr:uncharacterized protein LOC129000940 [Macrosteles quadrilineatus]